MRRCNESKRTDSDDALGCPDRWFRLGGRQRTRRCAFSTIQLTAPEGRYGWLNDFVYVGTLDSLRPQRQAVVIRVYKVV